MHPVNAGMGLQWTQNYSVIFPKNILNAFSSYRKRSVRLIFVRCSVPTWSGAYVHVRHFLQTSFLENMLPLSVRSL